MLKTLFLFTLIGLMAGCSDKAQVGKMAGPDNNGGGEAGGTGGGNPPTSESFAIAAGSVPSYSRNTTISVSLTRFEEPASNNVGLVHVFTNPNCIGNAVSSEAGLSVKHSRVLEVPLTSNVRNTVSVIAEFIDGTKSPCTFLAETIHDNVAPPAPAVAQTSYSLIQTYVHIPISNIPADAKSVLFYKDGNLIRTVSAALWRNNQGYLPLNQGETIQVFMAVEDHAGNVSAYSPAITVSHSNSSLAKPVLTSQDGFGQREGILLASPNLFVSGTITAGQTFEAFMHPNLTTPILVGTSSELASGVNLPLAVDATSTIYLYAVDILTNKSSPLILRAAYVTSPVLSYDITQTSLYPSSNVKADVSTDVIFRMTNASQEDSTGAKIPVSTLTVTTADPRIVIDNARGCPVTGLTPAGGCDLYATVNLPYGLHTPNATIVMNGVTVSRPFRIELINPIIKTMTSPQKTTAGDFLGTDPSGTYLVFQNAVIPFELDNLWSLSGMGPAVMNSMNLDGELFGITASNTLVVVHQDPETPAEKISHITGSTILKYYTPFMLSDVTLPDPIPEEYEYPTMNIEQLSAHSCRATRFEDSTEKTLNFPCQNGIAVISDTGIYAKTATGYSYTDMQLNSTTNVPTPIYGDLVYFENKVYASMASGIVSLNLGVSTHIQSASGDLVIIKDGVFIIEGSSSAVFYRGAITTLSGTLSKANVSITQRVNGSQVLTFPTQNETAIIEHSIVDSGVPVHTVSQTKIGAGFTSKVQASKVDIGTFILVGEQSGSITAITANSSAILATTGLGSGTILGGFTGNNSIVIATRVLGLLTLKSIGGGETSHIVDNSFIELPTSTGWVRVAPAYDGYGAIGYQTAGGYELIIVGTN